jgi:multisubunit Na+/H+ antiporter MnhB subunit
MLALGMVFVIGALLVFTVTADLLPFGSFPERRIGGFENIAVGQGILENAPQTTGARNVVTSVIWDYRGYDTLGEATVLFAAVCGIAMLFRVLRRER